MNALFKKILILLSSAVLLVFLILVSILWAFSNNLPDYKYLKNYKAPVSSKIYSGSGELIQDFSSEKRIFIPYNSIPKIVINSFLSAEDKNFFDHPGVDAKGVLRAIIKNISNILNSKIRFVTSKDLLSKLVITIWSMSMVFEIACDIRRYLQSC